MKKVLVSLLSIALIGCSQAILNNTSQYSDLDKEYSQFKTEALTQSYLKKKIDKWLSDAKYSKSLVREIEYAKFKHKDLLKDIVALQPTIFDNITANTAVTTKRIESPFENYIEYIDPYPSAVTANSATNVTTSSFTAHWTSNTKASSYKLFVNGNEVYSGANTSFDVTNLSFGTTPTYYVKAVNSAGTSPNSNTISVTLNPDTVTALNATDLTQTSFTANWSSLTGATSYKLTVDNNAPIDVGAVTSKSIIGLISGSSHTYSVQAVNSGGTGSSSNIITVNLNPAVPAVPTTLTATNIGQTSFTANWNSVSGATSYKLKVDNGAYVDVGNVTTYDISALTAGSSHNYYVQASNISGTSSGSTAQAVTLLPASPLAPVATIASSVTSTSFRANWNSVSGATAYKLYIDGSLAYTGTNLYYDKSGVVSGSSHTYYVQAYNTGGTSANSNEITVSIITNLTLIQSIPTNGGNDSEFFTIGTDSYLAIANEYNGSTRGVTSYIYKWNTSTSKFEVLQGIGTNGARGWKFFTIGTDSYLAVANYASDASTSTNSNIYKWNAGGFSFLQAIGTLGANSWEFIKIGTDYYISLANWANNADHIYKWNTSTGKFNTPAVQTISISSSESSKYFTMGTDSYLILGSGSELYKWNTGTSQFSAFQALSIASGKWEYFKMGTDSYLIGNTKLYKWNGSQFAEAQTFATIGNAWRYITIGSDSYLVGIKNPTSSVYKWDGSQFALFQTVNTSGVNDCEAFAIGGKTYLSFANWYNGSYILNTLIYRFD